MLADNQEPSLVTLRCRITDYVPGGDTLVKVDSCRPPPQQICFRL